MVSVTPKSRTLSNGTPNNAVPVEASFAELYANDSTLATAVTTIESGNTTITGIKTFDDALTANDTLTVTGAATFNGSATFNGTVSGNGLAVVGTISAYVGTSAPANHLLSDGKTIGSASSSATSLAHADASTLYTILWDSFSNTELVIQDSGGTPTTRGASAAADFAANKRMPLPDLRGRVIAGLDNMGGTSANRVTAVAADAQGGSAGAETHTLTTSEIPSHTHSVDFTQSGAGGSNINASYSAGIASNTGGSRSMATAAEGGGGAHNNMQPTLFLRYIIRYK